MNTTFEVQVEANDHNETGFGLGGDAFYEDLSLTAVWMSYQEPHIMWLVPSIIADSIIAAAAGITWDDDRFQWLWNTTGDALTFDEVEALGLDGSLRTR